MKDVLGDPENLPSVKEAHQRAAKIVTDRLEALRNEQQCAAAKDQERMAALKQRQDATQADEHIKMDVLHKMRERRETQERDARIRKGFMGLIDRITGKRRRIEAENQRLARKAKVRDTLEKDRLPAARLHLLRRLRQSSDRKLVHK